MRGTRGKSVEKRNPLAGLCDRDPADGPDPGFRAVLRARLLAAATGEPGAPARGAVETASRQTLGSATCGDSGSVADTRTM